MQRLRKVGLFGGVFLCILMLCPRPTTMKAVTHTTEESSHQSMPTHYSVMLPLIMSEPPTEIAVIDANATADWPTVLFDDFQVKHPSTWQSRISDPRAAGFGGVLLRVPVCSGSPASSCTVARSEDFGTIRIVSRALQPDHDVPSDFLRSVLISQGYSQHAVTIRGMFAWLLVPPTAQSLDDSIIVLRLPDHEYTLYISAGLHDDQHQSTMLGLMLGSLVLLPGLQSTDLIEASRTAWTNTLLLPSMQTQSSSNVTGVRQNILDEAQLYGRRMTNRDNCYIYANANGVSCSNTLDGGYEVDGAHFLDCVLHYANIDFTRCSRTTSHLSIDALKRNVLDPARAVQIDKAKVRPGDLILLYDPERNNYCWGAVVMAVGVNNRSGFYAAVHSLITGSGVINVIDADPYGLTCLRNGIYFTPETHYFSVEPDDTKPTVAWVTPDQSRLHVDTPEVLEWNGHDEQGGSGIAEYILRGPLPDGTTGILYQGLGTSLSLMLRTSCRRQGYTIQARDNADNLSDELPLNIETTLAGDIDLNGAIIADDIQLVDQSWDRELSDSRFWPYIDFNQDARIERADRIWQYLRGGHHCQ